MCSRERRPGLGPSPYRTACLFSLCGQLHATTQRRSWTTMALTRVGMDRTVCGQGGDICKAVGARAVGGHGEAPRVHRAWYACACARHNPTGTLSVLYR
jgi:hypothetical protein